MSAVAPVAEPLGTPELGTRPGSPRWAVLGVLALLAMVLLAYLPVIRTAGFIWDDDVHVVENTSLRDLEGLGRIWMWPLEHAVPGKARPPATPQYYPMVFTSFWLEWHLWGVNARAYHLVNILIHAATAWLLWLTLRRLKVPAAWVAAAIFALHPVQVESVAWISERKNTLALLFMVVSLLVSLKWLGVGQEAPATRKRQEQPWLYALALGLFVAAMCSKTVACALPVVLVLVVWWKGRLSWRALGLVGPMLVLGAAMGVLTIWIEGRFIGAKGADWALSWPDRVIIAGRALWFYPAKLIWPSGLTFIYPRWQINAATQWFYPASAALVGTAIAGLGLAWKPARPVTVAVLAYGALMFPALGFFNIYPMRYSFVADHFGYMGTVVLIVLIVGAAGWLVEKASTQGHAGRMAPGIAGALALAVLGTVGVLTWRQGRIYENQDTLWSDTLAKNPACWMAAENLGDVLRNKAGKELDPARRSELYERAVLMFKVAIALRPTSTKAYNGLGMTYADMGLWAKALDTYAEGNQHAETDDLDLITNLAVAYNATGQYDWARRYLANEVLDARPNDPAALEAMGTALEGLEKFDEAIHYYQRAIAAAPGNPHNTGVLHKIGVLQLQQNKIAEAKDTFAEALRMNPRFAEAYISMGFAMRQAGMLDVAIANYRRAIAINPENPRTLSQALASLGEALGAKGRAEDAVTTLRRAIATDPGLADGYGMLAEILSTTKDPAIRNPSEALRLAKRACELSANHDMKLLLLLEQVAADQHAYTDAVAAAQLARTLAEKQKRTALAADLAARIEEYKKSYTVQQLFATPGNASSQPATQGAGAPGTSTQPAAPYKIDLSVDGLYHKPPATQP